jgi:hypothetical protein
MLFIRDFTVGVQKHGMGSGENWITRNAVEMIKSSKHMTLYTLTL